MSRDAERLVWQSILDDLFPDGANCLLGEKQILCPRLMVVDVRKKYPLETTARLVGDWVPTVLVWDEANISITFELTEFIESRVEPTIWVIRRQSDVLEVSSFITPAMADLLRPLRLNTDDSRYKLVG